MLAAKITIIFSILVSGWSLAQAAEIPKPSGEIPVETKEFDAERFFLGEAYPFVILRNERRIIFTNLGNEGMSFFDAMQYCYRNGGRPAVLRSVEEDIRIMNNLVQIANRTVNSRPFWLGVNDIEIGGTFKWIGNPGEAKLTYTKWAPGSPLTAENGGLIQDCVSLQKTVDLPAAWINLPCSTMWRPLCQPISILE